jgi:branched-chain amino acid transport system substrate-binding protein
MPEHAASTIRSITTYAVWLAIGLAGGTMLGPACASSPPPRDTTTTEPDETQPDARGPEFERALEALRAERYEEARRLFDALSGRHAELYGARANLGALDGAPSESDSSPPPRIDEALSTLRRLADEPKASSALRRTAAIYLGLGRVRAGRIESAYEDISSREVSSLPELVFAYDRAAALAMLLEADFRAERGEETLRTAARLYRLVEDDETDSNGETESGSSSSPRKPAATSPSRTAPRTTNRAEATTSEWTTFAKTRAFHATSDHVAPDRLETLSNDDAPFVRAVAGWAHLTRELEQSDASKEERRRLDRLYRRISTDLTAIGESDRVAELSTDMATLGGKRRLVVGVLLPLSGNNRAIGERVLSGMLLAARSFQSRRSSRITLVFEDSNDDPASLFSTFERRDVAAVVGPLDDARARAFAPHARRTEIPMLALTARALERSADRKPYVFRNFMAPTSEARAVARIAFEELGDRRAAILHPRVGYGQSLARAFEATFETLGGRVVTTIAYDRSSSNFSDVAGRVAEAEPDLVFIPDTAAKAAELSAFLADEGVWGVAGEQPASTDRTYVHYVGTSLWYDPILPRQASQYVEGAVVPSWFAPVFQHAATRRFVRRFRAVFERTPENMEAFGFDSIAWVRRLMLERGLHTPETIRAAWLDGTSFRGATGTVSFDAQGRARRRLRFLTPTDEGFEPLSFATKVWVGEESDDEATDPPEETPKAPDREGPSSPGPEDGRDERTSSETERP